MGLLAGRLPRQRQHRLPLTLILTPTLTLTPANPHPHPHPHPNLNPNPSPDPSSDPNQAAPAQRGRTPRRPRPCLMPPSPRRRATTARCISRCDVMLRPLIRPACACRPTSLLHPPPPLPAARCTRRPCPPPTPHTPPTPNPTPQGASPRGTCHTRRRGDPPRRGSARSLTLTLIP